MPREIINKFGAALDIDVGVDKVVWDGSQTPGSYTYSTSADIDYISSSHASDNQTIRVEGCIADYVYHVEDVALDGQNKVAITPKFRVWRMENMSGTALQGDVYCYVDSTVTSGVPDTTANIRAKITLGSGAILPSNTEQTLMALYTVPAGKQGHLEQWAGSVPKLDDMIFKLWVRNENGVFKVKDIHNVYQSSFRREFNPPLAISEKSDIHITANSGTNSNKYCFAGFDIGLEHDES